MYKRKLVSKLTGFEEFKQTNNKSFTVLEFWQYGFSNLNSNVLRGALAEFIIENALKDKEEIGLRNPWGDSDIEYNGKKIEVKCSSYLQDWDQHQLSRIVWTGLKAKTLYWSSAENEEVSEEKADYKSDIYVFALVNHTDPDTLDLLNLNQWSFYILPREELSQISGNGSSVSLSLLEKHNVSSVHFQNLQEHIDSLT